VADPRPVGIFDSGVGGLTVWREVVRECPAESTIYLADQAHVPYGPRPAEQIRDYAFVLTGALLKRGCKAIVVACNTASAAALKDLRQKYPDIPFVGMEPAVKPAALETRTGVVGVMATPGTLQGRMFMLAVERFAANLTLVNQPCPGLVSCIESGDTDSPELEALLREWLAPMLKAGADTIVLACTHYPLVLPLIHKIAGPGVAVLEPSAAVARQLARLLNQKNLKAPEKAGQKPAHQFLTTGDPVAMSTAVKRLVGVEAQATRP
jgi:glutamate racemase